jgi:hypothetical protein
MEEQIELSDERVTRAFNTWMQRCIEHPEQFGREWEIVAEFLKQRESGVEPAYGEVCVGYLKKLIEEA